MNGKAIFLNREFTKEWIIYDDVRQTCCEEWVRIMDNVIDINVVI